VGHLTRQAHKYQPNLLNNQRNRKIKEIKLLKMKLIFPKEAPLELNYV
jgi:hypothetical protein